MEYTYDYAGRMKTLKTWRNFTSDTGAALTTWNYSAQRGFLLSKQYPDSQGPTYTYTAAGRLATRTWARGITTYYAYNPAGDLASVNYDDNLTPGVTHTYDRRGRRLSGGADGPSAASSLTYNEAGQITSETLANGLSITNTYDALLRRSSLTFQPFNSSTLYSYDNASRLASVSDGTNTATYTYVANASLVSQIAFTQSGQPRMTTTKIYDALNCLTKTEALNPSTLQPFNSFSYDYNAANQRTRTTHADASYWIYQYDTLGQVTSGKRFWADGTPVAGQQFEYGFDDIGNRQTAAHGGNAGGSNLRLETYIANDLNQYTQRTVPGFAEVQGRARTDATVTVNLQATTRQGPYWRSELMTDNSASPVWLGVTNVAVLRGAGAGGTDLMASNTGTLFLPQTPETYLHDADGNLTRDGRWTNSWDAENRLIRTESLGLETFQNSQFAILNSKVRQDWSFLPDGRWSQRIIYSWTDNDWLPQATNRFLWDGQVLLAVLNGANQPEQTYLRGLDLSGTPQGAGGVSGLLAVTLSSPSARPYPLDPSTQLACFDGNGNVTALVSADTAAETARYEYDPFGNTLRATGPAAAANSLRFSTQFADALTRRVKYLYRDYDAGTGRWMSRDPIEEYGGINLHAFVANSPPNIFDFLGLATRTVRYVGKSFINGIGPLGSLGNRIGGPFGPLPLMNWQTVTFAGQYADVRLAMYAATWISGLSAFHENPSSDAKDGEYRLYGKVEITARCCGSFLTSLKYKTDMEGGHELGPFYGTINMDISSSAFYLFSATVTWRTWGRPNLAAEPAMQWVALRTSVNIWHMPKIKITCNNGNPVFAVLSFRGSKYPSRRLWEDGVLGPDVGQGSFSSLWNAQSLWEPTMVAE